MRLEIHLLLTIVVIILIYLLLFILEKKMNKNKSKNDVSNTRSDFKVGFSLYLSGASVPVMFLVFFLVKDFGGLLILLFSQFLGAIITGLNATKLRASSFFKENQ